ncbi:MAG: AAA family ATPase [bacterium]
MKSAVIYGSNASGKSNVLKAIDFMKWMVLYSHKINPNEPIFPMMLEPFRLNTSSRNNPSFFELSFMTGEDIKYTYNFSLTKQKVVSENLIAYYSNKPTVLFTRE